MTIIMGVKKAGEVWVGSDRRLTWGISTKIDMTGGTDSKLVYLKNAVIGGAGDINFRNYLELFITKGENLDHPFTDKLSVIEFFINFKKFLKRHAGLGDSDSNQVQNMHNTDWLIATRDKLFEMDEDSGIVEFPDMVVVGCGQHLARGALTYMQTFQPDLSVEEMLKRAHEVTLANDSGCGGDQVRVNVTALLGPASSSSDGSE